MPAAPMHVGFVLEQTLGHRVHAQNLQVMMSAQPSIRPSWLPIPYEVSRFGARVPIYGSNWTVRAGVRARRGMLRLERVEHLDALFVHTQVPSILSADLFKRIPTVISLDATPRQYDSLGAHYGHELGGKRVEATKLWLNRRAFRNAAALVAWSAWTKRSLVEEYGVPAEKVTVVPAGVQRDLWVHEPGVRHGDAVRILFVGGDLVRKGGLDLLRAFRALRAEHDPALPELSLDVVTTEPLPPEAGVQVHIGLQPNSAELRRLYRKADIFCLPTLGDCLPSVLAEAGASGLPVVSTDVGAVAELVRDGETGVLVPVGDGAALAGALRELTLDPALRQRLGRAAAKLVCEEHDARTNASRVVALLHTVVER